VPIFLASSVTGDNLNLIMSMFNLLPIPNNSYEDLLEADSVYQIEEVYDVPVTGCGK
jgi:GTPase